MTVAELIDRLHKLPQDLPVYLSDWSEGYQPDIDIDYRSPIPNYERSLHPRVEEPYTARLNNGPRHLPRRVTLG